MGWLKHISSKSLQTPGELSYIFSLFPGPPFGLLSLTNSRYWEYRVEITNLIEKFLELEYQIEGSNFRQHPHIMTPWSEYPKALSFVEQIECARFDRKLCIKQVARHGLRIQSVIKPQRPFVEFFAKQKNMFGVEAGAKERILAQKAKFVDELIISYNSTHPDPCRMSLWCPIQGRYDWARMEDKHLFKWERGHGIMRSIFGPSAENDLFSPKNGLIISSEVNRMFNLGLFVLVPDVDSPESIEQWDEATTKEYKVKVLDPKHYHMKDYISANDDDFKKWGDLDGTKVQFRNEFRPAEKFLFWHYCVSVLRRSWVRDRDSGVLEGICKGAWPVSGSYMYRKSLLAFQDEIGSGISLLQGAIDKESTGAERDETALIAAVEQIRQTAVACNESPELLGKGEVLMSCALEDSDDKDESEDDDCLL